MMTLRFFSAFLIALLFAIVLTPFSLAQSGDVHIAVTAPESVQLNDDVTVVIELTDAEGNSLADADPEITFIPGHAVVDEVLYDCGDPEWYDGCRVNHRGVPGIFEVGFELIEDEVEVSVSVSGQEQSVTLQTDAGSLIPSAQAAVVSAEPASLSQVQVGPTPSFWFVVLPMLALCGVVSYFVFSTTD